MTPVNPNVQEPSKDSAGHSIIVTAKSIALLSALPAFLVPLTAAYYHYGQLNAFNLSESLFPVQLSDTPMLLHRALLSIVSNAFIPMLYAKTLMWYAILFGLISSLGIYIQFILRKRWTTVKGDWIKKNFGNPVMLSFFGGVMSGASFYIIPWILLLCSSMFLLIPAAGYYAGRYDGRDFLARWKACGKDEAGLRQRCTTLNMHEGQPGSQKTTTSYTGEIVAGNDKWLGIVTDTEILTLPADLQSIRVVRITK
jgi:hypothetical protein